MTKKAKPKVIFTPYYAVEAEGGRVGLTTCFLCGAAVLIDAYDEGREIHEAWHMSWMRPRRRKP